MAVIILVSIIIFGLAFLKIRWAVFAVAALLPTYLIRFSIGPLPSTLLEILILITVLVWFFKYRRKLPIPNDRLRSWRWPILFFLLAGTVSIIISPNQWQALGLFRAYLIEPILFFLVCFSVLRDWRDIDRLILAFGISALAVSGYAIVQWTTGFGIPSPWDLERRVTSFYPYPNAVGLFLGPLIPLFAVRSWLQFKAATLARGRTEITKALVWILMLGVSIMAVILSKTEGAWVGLLAGFFLLGCLTRPIMTAKLFLGILAIAALLAPPHILETAGQKLSLQDWSGQVRRSQWTETAAMLRDRPFFGAGLAGYPVVFRPYHKANYIEIFQYPHNIILNFWTELGLLGVIAFGWIVVRFFRFTSVIPAKAGIHSWIPGSRPRSPEDDKHKKLFVSGLICSMVTLLIHGLVDVPYFKNDLAVQFWILMAILTIMSQKIGSLPK